MSTLRTVRILRTLALSIIASAIAQAGTVTVTDVVTPNGGLFQYDYTITDGTDELAVLTIAVTPGITITDLTAPGSAGGNANPSSDFFTSYDSVNGLVSWQENAGLFSDTPEDGFIFDSSVGPRASTFSAALFDGSTITGGVTGPVVTPEPASLAPCLLGGAALLFWRKRLLASRPR